MLDIAAWVLTYLIHSTLIIGLVALCAPLLRRRPDVLSPLWKVALVGGLITATVQLFAGVGPSLGALSTETQPPMPRVEARAPAANPPRAITAETEAVPASTMPFGGAGAAEVLPPDPLPALVAEPLPAPAATPVASPADPSTPWWPYAMAGLLALGLVAAAVSLGSGFASLRRMMRRREALVDGPLLGLLRRLLDRAGSRREVALSVAPELAVPMATGVLRAEIVVPSRVAEHLPLAHQETLLAHELAHVLRRDPAWRVVGLVIERLFFFQPLNRFATRGIAQTAEYLCDDWAARSTDRPLDLARCLTEVAGWAAAGDATLAPAAVGGSGPRSVLGRRVQRLLQTRRRGSTQTRHIVMGAAALGLCGFVWLVPGIATSDAAEPPAVPDVPSVPGVTFTDDGITVVGTDDDGNPVRVVVSDDEVAIVSTAPSEPKSEAAPEPRTRKAKRKAKKDAAKARRRAEKDVRKAFRDARKNGAPAPDPDEVAAIVRRAHGGKAKAPKAPHASNGSSYELRIVVPNNGEPAIMLRRDGKVERIDIDREVERALREAREARAHVRGLTGEHIEQAIEQALREGHDPKRAEAMRRRIERQRKQAEKIQRQVHKELEKAAREQEKQMRELERMLRDGELDPGERVIIRQRRREMGQDTFPIALPPAAPVPPAAVAPPSPPRRVRAPRRPARPTPPSFPSRAPRAPTPPDVVSI